MSEHRKTIGKLPPTLQGIALDLEIGEKVGITSDEHHSRKHGDHFDVYIMRRVSESEVDLFKWHTHVGETGLTEEAQDLINNAIEESLTSEDTKDIRLGGC